MPEEEEAGGGGGGSAARRGRRPSPPRPSAQLTLCQGAYLRFFWQDDPATAGVAQVAGPAGEVDYAAVRAKGKTLLVNLPLGDFESRLDPARFVRVHRSHLVNLDFVEAIEPFDNSQSFVRMKDGAKITASRTASKRLRDWAV